MLARPAAILCLLLALAGCDKSEPAPKADDAAKKEAQDADQAARLEQRKKDREAKAEAEKKAKEDKVKKIQEITAIPEGTKMPKKPIEACNLVVEAQRGFMKRFHPQIEEAALTTQLGLLAKQCKEQDVKISMCQKFALDATTDDLKGDINEYLPVCMEKYGKKDG
jgi:hypothetical protein